MIVRARVVLPVAQPPIENGAVAIRGEEIVAVGPWPEIRRAHDGPVSDYEESILLPGLINAHCHLDYTNMAGLLPPARSFASWIRSIVALKATWSDSTFADSWQSGAQMLLNSGTTTVVDFEAIPAIPPQLAPSTPLNVISCFELMSLRRAPAEVVREAVQQVAGWPGEVRGLSPHAPYTTSADLLGRVAHEARIRGWLHTSHVAESSEEFDMFTNAAGPLFEWLSTQRDMSDCGKRTPVQHVDAAGGLDGLLAAHANYVTPEDIQRLAHRQAHVVHCPRSHEYFQHQPFPYDALRRAGVNLCLGTDSLATVHIHSPEGIELDLTAEMRCFHRRNPEVPPCDIVHMVTVNGAKALGRAGHLGALIPGARADLVVMRAEHGDPYEAVVQHRGTVGASMIRGAWVSPDRRTSLAPTPLPAVSQPS